MNRSIVQCFFSLALFAWLSGDLRAFQDAFEGFREKPRQMPALQAWPQEAVGIGLDEQEAKREAIKNAVTKVRAFILSQSPPLEAWTPTEDFVKANFLELKNSRTKTLDEFGEKRLQFTYTLRDPTPTTWNQMVQRNEEAQRRLTATDRQWLSLRVLLLASAALGCCLGYMKLDDWTGGRFSRWLQFIGVAFLAGTATSLWFMS